MTQINEEGSPLNVFRRGERKVMRFSQEELVTTSYLNHSQQLPLVMRPSTYKLDLAVWAGENRAYIEGELGKHGAILFRDFDLESVPEFERFIRAVSGGPLEYTERSSPRTQISGQIYTSTDYRADKEIFLHNEQSYNLLFPMKILFYCVKSSREGGATPIADTRRVFGRISDEVKERFLKRKYMYVRNFGDGFGLSWQEAFQTSSKSKIKEYCHSNRIEYEWRTGNRLRTKQVREVAARHPKTGEWVWFNHLTFFHFSTLDRRIQEEMMRSLEEEKLPNNTYYGDGQRIEEEVMTHLREAYQKEKVRFDWQGGDILVLDNMLAAHGREAYTGDRSVAVGMAEAWSWDRV
jgi:alpha-ketoglutarate-dependent taurine dioxygenase